MYDEQGVVIEDAYYAVVRSKKTLYVDYSDYHIEQPLSTMMCLVNKSERFLLLYVNYNNTKYRKLFVSTAKDKANYRPVPVYNPITNRTKADVYIK